MHIWAGEEELLLEVKNLTARYGAVMALKNVSFEVGEGEIVAMIGPNGAGKSTALKAVSGLLPATDGSIDTGEILFEGNKIKGLRTDELVGRGMSLVPEGRRVFPTMMQAVPRTITFFDIRVSDLVVPKFINKSSKSTWGISVF